MSLKSDVKDGLYDVLENVKIHRARQAEIAKFKDPKRKSILSDVELSSEQMRAIDKFYVENYGRKIPYTWHRHNLAISGKFDVRFFPELLFIPEFERYMNMPVAYATVFEDKNLLPLFAERAGVRTPRPIVTSTSGVLRNSDFKEISKETALNLIGNCGACFAKPTVGTCSGEGCGSYCFASGADAATGTTAEELFELLGSDFTVQEVISCHSSVVKLHPESVNTLRIMTYRWQGELRSLPLLMRIGRGKSAVDNAHAGGMFIGISNEGLLAPSALTEFNDRFEKHPDTGVVFQGYKIAGVPGAIDAAKRMHSLMPQMGLISWDFTIGEDGAPIVIEANIRGGSILLSQMANGIPGFGDATAEILQWLRFMNNLAPHERLKYKFGYKDLG